MGLLAAMSLPGCHSAVAGDPAIVYQDARSEVLHGDFDAALKKAQQGRRDFSAGDSDWPMKFRLLQAEVLTYEGRRPEVIALLNSPGVTFPAAGDLAIKKNLLCGLAHARLDQAQLADTELQQASMLAAANNSELKGEVLRAESVVQLYRHNLPAAADLAAQSLEVARKQRDPYLEASDLLNLGLAAVELRHYDQALALLSEAAETARPIRARAILGVALGNLGLAYFHLGDFARALANFQQAEQGAREMGTASLQVDWLMDAGSAYSMLNKLQDAKSCFEQSLRAAQAIDASAEIADIQASLAFLLYRQGQFDFARTHNEEALRAARKAGDKSEELEPLYLRALLSAQQKNGQDAERLLLQVNDAAAADPALQGEVEGALADFYAARQQATKANLWYRKSIHTFEEQRAAVGDEELRLPFFANGDELYRRYAGFLIASHQPEDALQLLDISRARTLAEGLRPTVQGSRLRAEQPANMRAVARRLHAAILFYSLGAEGSYVWAVTAESVRLFALANKAEIEAQVAVYQKAILRSSDPLHDANETAQSLYHALVSPAVGMIPQGSKVFIVPDGILNGLNFETLLAPGPQGPHYWIQDVSITNASSIRLLSRVDPASSIGADKKLLLIGNPTSAGTGYQSLVNAFAEMRGIEKHFPAESRTVVSQSLAVPGAYEGNRPEQYAYIHFVAHGTASLLDPLDSAVVLSPPAGNPADFKLYARDIMRCALHARLVTISACYGSGLRDYAGEGLVGLSWAFLRAGSHNVIGALWEVNDASTPLLMDRLYGQLEAGSSPDAALRAAKLSLIHSQAVYRKPLYWGAFQLYSGS